MVDEGCFSHKYPGKTREARHADLGEGVIGQRAPVA